MKYMVLVLSYLILGGCQLGLKKSEVEIVTNLPSKVFIDDRESGDTTNSYKMTNLKPGEINLRLVPEDLEMKEWASKLKLNNLTTTVVNRKFSKDEKYSSGYVMYPEKIGADEDPALIINSKPADASIKIDGQLMGRTPTKIEKVIEGDRNIVVSYPGFESQNLFVKTKKGYQIVIDVQLASTKVDPPEVIDKPLLETSALKAEVVIKETGTGWLRVRDVPSTAGREVAKVDVDKKYLLLEDNDDGWYKIEISSDLLGWISAEYAEIVRQ